MIFETHRKVGFFMAATLAGCIIFSCGFSAVQSIADGLPHRTLTINI